jgi:hypothetical protein
MKKFTDKINESVEDKIPTAEQFTRQTSILHDMWDNTRGQGEWNQKEINKILVEFAKLHVEAALKAASEKVSLTDFAYEFLQEGAYEDADGNKVDAIDKDTILNAYPLDNIK